MTLLPVTSPTHAVSGTTGRHHVDVTCDADTLAGLLRLAEPFFTAGPPEAGRARARVLACTAPPGGPGWTRVVYTSPYEPDRVLWTHEASRTVAVCGEPSSWRTQQLLRCVRNLLRWEHFADGELFLHGGLVVTGGRGIAFAGRKRSGKTSSILSALLHAEADFVSNDDLVISPGTGLRGLGFPRSVNVRTDSLLALARRRPELRSLLSDVTHPANRFPGVHHTPERQVTVGPGLRAPAHLWVRVRELTELAGAAVRPSGPVSAVVFPVFDASAVRPEVRRLSGEEARQALAANTEPTASAYDPFLAAWYPRTRPARRAAIADRLVRTVPCYRLTQHMQHLDAATEALRSALDRDLPG